MDIKFSSAVVLVNNVELSRKFYESLLGQQVEYDHGECVGYAAGFAIWERKYAENLIFGKPPTRINPDQHDLELYFETEKLDEVFKELQAGNVEMVHEIQEQPWGQRVLRVYDPDHTVIEIAETLQIFVKRYLDQGMTPEQAAARTSMPLEFVRTVK